jgi:cell division initiation protein
MKLTPMDIHQQEFRHSLRGYADDEVDAFLDKVADEFERLFKENIDLSEKLEAARQQVAQYEAQKETLHNTMVAAQRASEEMAVRARSEAEVVMRDAEQKAKEIIHVALQKKQAVANELVRIKSAEEEFRSRYKGLLETQLRAVAEISLPEDVNVLLGETEDGIVGDVAVTPQSAFAAELEAPAAVEPPASGFVSSVALGEMGAPEIEPGSVELIDTGEYTLSGFDSFGEREDDVDIEEID